MTTGKTIALTRQNFVGQVMSLLFNYSCPADDFISTIFLDSIYMCVNIQYLFFSFWCTLLCIIASRFIYLSSTDSNSFLLMAEWFSVYIVPQLLDPFICRWTSRLLLCLGYCKLCWNGRWDTCIFLNYGWFSQSICPIVGLLCHMVVWGFPGGSDGKESACNAGDLGLIPGLGRSPGEGNSYPLQYSCLENSMDRGTWWATVHWVTNSQIWLNDEYSHCFTSW